MPGCVLRYCSNNTRNTNKHSGITFHRFPHATHVNREKWVKFVQNNRSEDTWLPSDYSCICSLHFRKEDKYFTKTGRHFLKKSAVPYEDKATSAQEVVEPISEPVSDSDSIFDTPQEISLKHKIRILTRTKKKLTDKIKKVQRQNRHLRNKCASLTFLVKSIRSKYSHNVIAEKSLPAKTEFVEIHKSMTKCKEEYDEE